MNETWYIYLWDRMTDPLLADQRCTAVRRPDGKCIRGKNGNMLVKFDCGRTAFVIARLLRKIKEGVRGRTMTPND